MTALAVALAIHCARHADSCCLPLTAKLRAQAASIKTSMLYKEVTSEGIVFHHSSLMLPSG